MYSQISSFYPELFPVNRDFIRLLHDLVPRKGSVVLDLACGPGHYVAELAADYEISGVDADENMIGEANHLVPGAFSVLAFSALGDLRKTFDCIYCIGNSLSYLPNTQLEKFLGDVSRLLNPSGLFLCHTVNWDAYLETREMDFEPKSLSNGGRFTRRYEQTGTGEVHFHSCLQSGNRCNEWVDVLHPKSSRVLTSALQGCGFAIEHHWGNYRQESFEERSSDVSIFVSRRK